MLPEKMVTKVLLTVMLFHCLCAEELKTLPNVRVMREWAKILQLKLEPVIAATANVTLLQESYKQQSKNAKITPLDGEMLLQNMADRMIATFRKKKEALQRLVDAAGKAFSEYEYNEELDLREVTFVNVKDFRNTSILEFSPNFKQNVTFSASGVHVPLELYDGWMGPRYKVRWWKDPEVLNGVKWSAALDSAFKENIEKDSSLRWQFFGSQSGFMRIYPAFKWPEIPDSPDMFDARRRPWYIQAAASPKDIMVLMDTSGSVHGQTFKIEKAAVKALLNTLGENDYVNIAWFNTDVGWVVPCFNTLVNANSQHKKVLFEGIEALQEGNLTNYANALTFAFEAIRDFEKGRNTWEGADCHKAIMLFSDGSTEWPQEVLDTYLSDPVTQNVRIFTVAVGPHPIPTVTLKMLACNTSGFHSQIAALESVRSKIHDYVKFLSIPLVLSGNKQLYQWSNFYQDAAGLGMMTTVTLPVISRDVNRQGNQSLVGVAGVDIPVSAMVDFTPWESMGSHGYSFAIDRNGYVLFHPYVHRHVRIFVEDPPDIDVMYAEAPSARLEDLRKDMIDGKRGEHLISSHLVLDNRYSMPLKLKYYFTPVSESTFSLGLAMPEDQMQMDVDKEDYSFGLDRVDPEATFLPPWKFCNKKVLKGPHQEIVRKLSVMLKSRYSECDHHLSQHLLWDQRAVQSLLHSWMQAKESPFVDSRFVATDGGLTIVHPKFAASQYRSWANVYNNTVFRMAAMTSEAVFSVNTVKASGGNDDDDDHDGIKDSDGDGDDDVVDEPEKTVVTIASRVILSQGIRQFVPAVVGANVKGEHITSIFSEFTDVVKTRGHWSCEDTDQLMCYLVDGGGFVIASNRPEVKMGEFLGSQDVQLMHGLLNQSIYRQLVRYDFQSTCMSPPRRTSMGGPSQMGLPSWLACLHPSRFLDVRNLLDMIRTYLYGLVLWWYPSYVEALPEFEHKPNVLFAPPVEEPRPCTTKSARYYQASSGGVRQGAFTCGECSRWFSTARVEKTNTLLMVAALPCQCEVEPETLPHTPQEDKGPEFCGNSSLYRRRPELCYDRHELEDPANCVSGASTFPWRRILWLLNTLLPLVLLCYSFGN